MARYQHKLESWTTALVSNAIRIGQVLIITLWAGSVGLLAVTESTTDSFVIHGHLLKATGRPHKYKKRLDVANELIEETGRNGWAIGVGMIPKPTTTSTTAEPPIIM